MHILQCYTYRNGFVLAALSRGLLAIALTYIYISLYEAGNFEKKSEKFIGAPAAGAGGSVI